MIADFEAYSGAKSYRFTQQFFEDQAAQTPDSIAVVKIQVATAFRPWIVNK